MRNSPQSGTHSHTTVSDSMSDKTGSRSPSQEKALSAGCAKTAIWPPRGWPMFACITRSSGTAISQSLALTGKQTILSYKVHCFKNNEYALEILHGTIRHNGEISLTSALSIHFGGREDWGTGPKANSLFEVQVLGAELPSDHQTHLRAILAITYIISRIDRGLVPDIYKTLSLYRLNISE